MVSQRKPVVSAPDISQYWNNPAFNDALAKELEALGYSDNGVGQWFDELGDEVFWGTPALDEVIERVLKRFQSKTIRSMSLSKLSPILFEYFEGIAKDILKRYPGGKWNHNSTTYAFQVFDKNEKFLASYGWRGTDGHYPYITKDDLSGSETSSLAELKSVLKNI